MKKVAVFQADSVEELEININSFIKEHWEIKEIIDIKYQATYKQYEFSGRSSYSALILYTI